MGWHNRGPQGTWSRTMRSTCFHWSVSKPIPVKETMTLEEALHPGRQFLVPICKPPSQLTDASSYLRMVSCGNCSLLGMWALKAQRRDRQLSSRLADKPTYWLLNILSIISRYEGEECYPRSKQC